LNPVLQARQSGARFHSSPLFFFCPLSFPHTPQKTTITPRVIVRAKIKN
jgi:hypothetical protein